MRKFIYWMLMQLNNLQVPQYPSEFRITDDSIRRITDDGSVRITDGA